MFVFCLHLKSMVDSSTKIVYNINKFVMVECSTIRRENVYDEEQEI